MGADRLLPWYILVGMATRVDEGAFGSWSQVTRFVSMVDAEVAKWLMSAHGLGLTEYYAALHIVQASDKELRLNELAVKLGLNQSSVTRLVGRLEAKGLAFRDTCPDDARGIYVALTQAGVATVAEVRQRFSTHVEAAVSTVKSGLSAAEQELFAAALSQLSNLMK